MNSGVSGAQPGTKVADLALLASFGGIHSTLGWDKPIWEIGVESWTTAEEKGWHTKPRSLAEELFLAVGEITEALTDIRHGLHPSDIHYEEDGKPCGIATEIADTIIRLMDTVVRFEIPLGRALHEKLAYNKTREHRHGGKVL